MSNSRTNVAAVPSDERASLLDTIPLLLRMLVYGVSFLALILVLLPWCAAQLDPLLPAKAQMRLPGVVRFGGVVLFLGLLTLYVASSYVLTHHGRGAYVEFDPPREFVASGPFRWCRNPIAASVVGMLLAEAIVLSSTGVLLLALLAIPLAHVQVVLLEEPLLRKRFGEAYENYLRRVPRWLPRPPREARG